MPEKKPSSETETLEADSRLPVPRSLRLRLPRIRPKSLYANLLNRFGLPGVGHLLVGSIAIAAGLITANDSNIVRLWERHAQTLFFDIRGPVAPPGQRQTEDDLPEIVILAIDGDSINQGSQFYPSDPQEYAYLKPIERWPWRRAAYAVAIDKLMQAGARTVALDIVFDTPSSYGPEDDEQLRQVLAKYPGRVVLAAQYIEEEDATGSKVQILMPNAVLQQAAPIVGGINFLLSSDGRIHSLASEYVKQLKADYGSDIPEEQSFTRATLKGAQIPFVPPKGQDIFFYGPTQTFKQISFWQVLDPASWQNVHLKNQTFKDKIVLIGPTDKLFQDFHAAPFSSTPRYPDKMAGVEVQANAIATLMENKSIVHPFSNLLLKGVFVGCVVLAACYVESRTLRPLRRFWVAIALSLAWGTIGYSVFVQGRMVLPTSIPMVAIALTGVSYLFTGVVSEKLGLRKAAKRYASSPIFQEFISEVAREGQHSDLKPLLEAYHQEFIGRLLDGRYKILSALGAGGFGATYIAEDCKRPGKPQCVVKRLSPRSDNPKVIRYARARFPREAESLEKLGKHPQIPQLLAYFEENDDFYLVLEYIEGKPLEDEFKLSQYLGRQLPERLVVGLLQDLLQILDFVHSQGVIHRDIKPSNIIRRKDGSLVLIDFGAVKEFNQLDELDDQAQFTVAIGTDGFMAPEQAHGKPRPASDIYAVGMMGIQALTGIMATELKNKRDSQTAELHWREAAQVSHAFAEILDKMVSYHYVNRYQTAREVLTALEPLAGKNQLSSHVESRVESPSEEQIDDIGADTRLWPDALSSSLELPPTDQSEGMVTVAETAQYEIAEDGEITEGTDRDGH